MDKQSAGSISKQMGKKKDYRLGTALKKDRNRERQGKLSRAGSWVSFTAASARLRARMETKPSSSSLASQL